MSLTADDVKWSWDRKFELGAIGAFFLSTLGLEKKDGVKVEGKYTVSINLDNPNPLLAKLQPNLYNPIYDFDEVQTGIELGRSLGAQVPREQLRRLRSLPPGPVAARTTSGFQGEGRLLSRQAGHGHGGLSRGADFGHAGLSAARRRRRYRSIPAAAGDHQVARREGRGGRQRRRLLHDLAGAQRPDCAVRQRRRSARR